MAVNNTHNISIASINTQGLKSNTDYVFNDIIKNNDIIFICEHWLSTAEKHIIENGNKTHKLYFTSAEKHPAGRPFGGNCFLIKNSLNDTGIKVIHEDAHILAFQLPKLNLLIIGIYLTCYHDTSSKEKYISELNTITAIMEMYLDESEIMIVGDFQTFPSDIYDNAPRNNDKRNPLSPLLRDFLYENELQLSDITEGAGPTQTYEHKTLKNSSYVDHVAVLKNSNLSMSNCAIHTKTANNLSDHQPITFTISTILPTTRNESSLDIIDEAKSSPQFVPRFAWSDPTFQQNYQQELSLRLNTDENHGSVPESEAKHLNNILLDSGKSAFLTTFPQRKSQLFSKDWWNPELTRSKSILSAHFNAWRTVNFPKDENNVFFNRYQLARTNFRKAVKAAQNKLVYEKYTKINSLKYTDSRKFWKNMRNLKESNIKRPFTINSKETDEDITREFADHFNTLLNNPRGSATNKYDPLPDTSDEEFTTSSADVFDAISSLKTNKSKDSFGVLSEHFIHAADNETLVYRLATLYTNMFKEQNTPPALSLATLIPLVKSYRKSLKSPNNYRGISLIPILTKILEYMILKKCPILSESNPSQFGFKRNSSTLHAEFLINETVNFYKKHGSTVYMCSLDAEKAFDSCNWSILFEKLYYEKKVPLPVVNVLKSLYVNGTYQVLYNGHLSYKFNASQGVFQGSILSPHFYNSYTQELLETIRSSANIGTSIYNTYTGIVAYADDIILMSSTLSGLQQLINKCTQYYSNTAITLNVAKTEFLTSGLRTPAETYIELYHHQIHPHDKLKHLGFIWNKKRNFGTLSDANVQERINKFWSVIHALIKGGIRFCQPESIIELYKTLAVPTLTYGLELPHLSQTQLDNIDKQGRIALKSLFNISRHSKNHLNAIFNLDHISIIITNNKMNLISRLMCNNITRDVIISTLQSTSTHQSTVHDCYTIAATKGINFYDILLNTNYTKEETVHNIAPILDEIRKCLLFWNVGGQRKQFKTIMEDRVIRSVTQD